MKYYNIELSPLAAVDLKQFLHDNKIMFESSGADNLVHFEIYASKNQVNMINSFLDTLYI